MFRYVILFSLCITALAATSETNATSIAPNAQRKARSIWPFTSSDASEESAITGEHAKLLEQAGLDGKFNLSSHPLWKIHKYHGIDLKPVHIETEIVKSNPTVGNDNNTSDSKSANGESTSDDAEGATSELPDLSFLDDLGGLAAFLPDPKEEDEATDLIANAIEAEGQSNPGFFKKLWWKIWGAPENSTDIKPTATKEESALSALGYLSSFFGFGQDAKEEEKGGSDGDAPLTIYLPETQGSYMAVVLPADKTRDPLAPQQSLGLPSQTVPQLFQQAVTSVPQALEPPTNHATNYRDEAGATTAASAFAQASVEIPKPVAQWPGIGATAVSSASAQSNLAIPAPVAQILAPVAQIPAPVAQIPGSGAAASNVAQGWIQSWTPYASYYVRVQGPSSQHQQQPPAEGAINSPLSRKVSQSYNAPSDIVESGTQPELPISQPPIDLEALAPVEANQNADLIASWPQILTHDVPPVLEAFENIGSEQQASRKSSQDAISESDAEKSQETNGRVAAEAKMREKDEEGGDEEKNEAGNEKKNDAPAMAGRKANDDLEKMRDILSHFRIPEGLLKKLQVSQKDVDTMLNDKESAARAAERLRSLQKEFEMRKEQLSYVYATRVKKEMK